MRTVGHSSWLGQSPAALGVAGALAITLLLGLPNGAHAQAEAEVLATCQDEELPSEERIAGCNRIIDDPRQAPDMRAEALLNRALAFEQQEQHEKALADYGEAIKLNEHYPALYFHRGALFERLGRLDPAIDDFSMVLKLLPDDPAALAERADCLLAAHRHEQAIGDYSRLIELDPTDADAYVGRALGYEATSQLNKAMADFRKALEIEPSHEDALQGLKRLGQSL